MDLMGDQGQSGMGLTMAMGAMGNTMFVKQAEEVVDEEEMIKFIVESVNKELNRKYSLVDFDGLQNSTKLLQVFSDIVGVLSPEARVDFNVVEQRRGSDALQNFLIRTLGYRVPSFISQNFATSFSNGDTSVLYPVMYWTLKHMEQNRKRVYLARFLVPLDVPEDIRMQDEDVRGLYETYENLRARFVQTHKRVDAAKTANADPVEARKKIEALEQERDRLNSNIGIALKKLESVPSKDAMLAAAGALRMELEEESKLQEKRVEQQQDFISAKRRHADMSKRLQSAKRDLADSRVESIVRRLQDEIQTNRMLLDGEMEKEVDVNRQMYDAIRKLSTEPLDFPKLTAELGSLNDRCAKLEAQMKEREKPGADGSSVLTVRQQVSRVLNKKKEVLAELQNSQGDNDRVVNEIREKELLIQQLRDGNMLKGEDFRKYSNQVRAKTQATKNMKTRLSELRAEWGVLSYTEKTLQNHFEELRTEIEDIEARMGIRGYSKTAESLTKITDEKNAVEQIKGQTLEELSKVVQEFTFAIRDRRSRLAPQINELRTLRQAAGELEEQWSEKKSQYDYQEGLLTQDVTKLEQDVTNLDDETRVNEALFHRLTSQMMLIKAHELRVQEEEGFRNGNGRLSEQDATYQSLFTRSNAELEEKNRDLQRRRRDIEENHSGSVQQVEWFNSLLRIVEAKLQSLRTQGAQMDVLQGDDVKEIMGGAAGDNVNMLVLGNE